MNNTQNQTEAPQDERTTTWIAPDNMVSCVQNLINGCLLAQSKGVYSMEESSILWNSITFLITKQKELREANPSLTPKEVLENQLSEEMSTPE